MFNSAPLCPAPLGVKARATLCRIVYPLTPYIPPNEGLRAFHVGNHKGPSSNLMDWYFVLAAVLGLTVSSGGRALQFVLRALHERFANGSGEDGLNFPTVLNHRQPRR